MNFENIKKIKVGDEIQYKIFSGIIYTGIVKKIRGECCFLNYGVCSTRDDKDRRCMGKFDIQNKENRDSYIIRCGVEDGWSLIDPKIEFEDFITEEEMMI